MNSHSIMTILITLALLLALAATSVGHALQPCVMGHSMLGACVLQ